MVKDLATLRNELENLEITIKSFQMACDRYGEAERTTEELKGLRLMLTGIPEVNWDAIELEIQQEQQQEQLEAEELQRQDLADYWQSTAGSLTTSNGHLHY
jgi:SpoVK/Ycf46/Vps4 family AAA+-type ATPase